MNRKKITLQMFTSGYQEKPMPAESVIETLKRALEMITVDRIIIGWSTDRAVYEAVIDLAHRCGIEVFLWLPVFSETGLLKQVSLLKDFRGQEVRSYQLKEGENFEFYCPNHEQNLAAVRQIYEEHFSTIGFDGVFLDKIRYASFANNLEGVFSCFCPNCIARYQQAGLDPDLLKQEMAAVANGSAGYAEQPLQCLGYESGRYEFADPVWSRFFDLKAQFITQAMQSLCSYFRSCSLKIGMDVFAPFMAPFVGQDLQQLSAMADFMKPMMYRITNAPAGLPFEYRSFLQAAGQGDSGQGDFAKIQSDFNYLLGIDRSAADLPFDLAFVKRELTDLSRLGGKVSCGIEVNCIAGQAEADPDYIRETMMALADIDLEGYVLSWDILSAPQNNLSAVKQVLSEQE